MAKNSPAPRFSSVNDSVTALLDGIARFLMVGGGLVFGIGVLLLFYMFFNSNGSSPEQIQNIAKYIDPVRQMAIFGSVAASIGVSWLMWGEETAGPIMLIVGLALVFAPSYLAPSGQGNVATLQTTVVESLRNAGIPAVIVGVITIAGDVASRMKVRMKQGAKADQMKYGKDVKEERDTRNVFFGKCWQLPYCRKFVRERCPIYHAKRTCWNERVGCMCEETVIKNAMEGKAVSTDPSQALKLIPKNNKLTPAQKAERCRQCVIYNEHQKHKYKLALPVTALGIAGLYIGLRVPLGNAILGILSKADQVATDLQIKGVDTNNATTKVTALKGGVIPYHEIILFVGALVLLAYAIKVLEYLFFRAKV